MKSVEGLLSDFKCPKCRNTTGAVKEVALGSMADRISLVGSGKYLFLSCTLCGYTEVYNQKILANAKEKKQESREVTAGEPASSGGT
jgi:predicted nucleic-acid-binding Zn-ribbon protein